jgi:hypothetical protein
MRRKTSDTPNRLYSYGCRPPVSGRDVLEEQLRLAHHYSNRLVEIERRRRERVQEAMRSMSSVAPAATRVDELEMAIQVARAAVKTKRIGAGRHADTSEETTRTKALVAELRVARGALREAKQEVREDETLRACLRSVDEQARQEIRDARKASGLYWGTYLQVEAAADQARKAPTPPRFTPYDGSGRIAVQLQHGMTVSELFACKDWCLRIQPVPADTYQRPRHQRRLASRTMMWIRAGSGTTDRRRGPLWVQLPIILHRPLPDDAMIKWAWLLRRKIGTFEDYRLQLIVESEAFREPPAPTGAGTVAIDLGWRNKPDGTVRVAYWLDDQRRSGEVLVPLRTQIGLEKPHDLASIRDKAFDIARDKLRSWRAKRTDIPRWLVERTRFLMRWRAPRRLAALLPHWSQHRVDGDRYIISVLNKWAKQDRHLRWWELNQRDRRLGHRREQYRLFATQLARTYATIVLEKFDLRGVLQAKPPEDGVASDGRDQRRTAALAAPGQLRAAIKASAQKTGARVVEVDAANTTRTCSICGVCEPFKASTAIAHTCAHCGATWDQDHNACANLLALASDVNNQPSSPLGEGSE